MPVEADDLVVCDRYLICPLWMGFTYCLLLYIEVNFTNFYALGIRTPPSVGMPKLEVDLSALGLFNFVGGSSPSVLVGFPSGSPL